MKLYRQLKSWFLFFFQQDVLNSAVEILFSLMCNLMIWRWCMISGLLYSSGSWNLLSFHFQSICLAAPLFTVKHLLNCFGKFQSEGSRCAAAPCEALLTPMSKGSDFFIFFYFHQWAVLQPSPPSSSTRLFHLAPCFLLNI